MDSTSSAMPVQPAAPFEEHLLRQRPSADDARFDMTAMVDLVFMLNIFFLVTWVTAALAEVDLPPARHCVAADPDSSLIVTITSNASAAPSVYLGDARPGAEIHPGEVETRVAEAVEAGTREGKSAVLIKAERDVPLRDVVRVARVATSAKFVKLNLAVMEKE